MRNVGNQFGQLEYHGENLQPEPTKWISNWLIINHKVCAFVTCVLVCALRFPHQWSSVLINFEITPKCRRGRGCGFSISISVHAFILLNFHSVLPLSLSPKFPGKFPPTSSSGEVCSSPSWTPSTGRRRSSASDPSTRARSVGAAVAKVSTGRPTEVPAEVTTTCTTGRSGCRGTSCASWTNGSWSSSWLVLMQSISLSLGVTLSRSAWSNWLTDWFWKRAQRWCPIRALWTQDLMIEGSSFDGKQSVGLFWLTTATFENIQWRWWC